MQLVPTPTQYKMRIYLDSVDDKIVLKNEDFLMGIFSFYDKNGKKLFVAKMTDVEIYITDELYKRKVKNKNIMQRLISAGIQGW